jgi:threonylcarbamoyladenosine tRNA methylthiotransferase MtaB
MPAEAVLTHIARIQQAGYKEVVLTGIHLGCYGQDLKPPIALIDLLDRIHRLKTIARIRLSSIEPHEISDALIELVARSNKCPGMLCNHFHIPLQSGDDRILQKMHRPYDRKFFSKLVHRIRRAVPAAAIGVDILAGFPGETEGAFKNTYDLIAELPVTYLHVFPFSARPGTPASNYPDPISPKIIKQRCRALRTLGLQKKAQFFRQQLGQTVEVLVEQKRDRLTGLLKGLTSNYIPVLIDADDSLMNTFATVTLEASRGPCLIGALVAAKEKKVE